MGFQAWVGAYGKLITNAAKREHTPVRESFAKAREILYAETEAERGEGELEAAIKLEESGKKRKLDAHFQQLLNKDIKEGGKFTKEGIEKLKKSLKELLTDEVLILHFLLTTMHEIVSKDRSIEQQLPSIKSYEQTAGEELKDMARAIFQMQNPSVLMRRLGHRRHYFARRLFSNQRSMLQDERNLDKWLRILRRAFEEHNAGKVKKAEQKIGGRVRKKVIPHVKEMLDDTIALVYIVLGVVKRAISEEKTLARFSKEIAQDEQWAERQLAEITREAMQGIQNLRAVPNIGA